MNAPRYERLAHRIVYRNAWLHFEAHDMVHPTGVRGEHGVVVTPPASAVVALDKGDVLLIRQPRFAVDADVLEVIKGGVRDGEDALACAQRETREEAAMTARRWQSLGTAFEIPSIVAHPVALFLARDLEPDHAAEPETIELLTVVRVPLADAVEACIDGRIDDAVTALALLRAQALLAREHAS